MVQYIMDFALDFVLITKVQKKRADRKGWRPALRILYSLTIFYTVKSSKTGAARILNCYTIELVIRSAGWFTKVMI